MRRDFRRTKLLLLTVLATLLAADAGMAIFSMRAASSSVNPQHQLAQQTALLKLLRADINRAREIQQAVPKTKADCDLFENSLPPASTGYSLVSTEIQDLSQKAGLQTSALAFHPKDIAGRGVTEVSIDASISGDYDGVVKFLKAIQQSQNHYVVETLTLANDRGGPGGQGAIRLNLHMRSYFKANA